MYESVGKGGCEGRRNVPQDVVYWSSSVGKGGRGEGRRNVQKCRQGGPRGEEMYCSLFRSTLGGTRLAIDRDTR